MKIGINTLATSTVAVVAIAATAAPAIAFAPSVPLRCRHAATLQRPPSMPAATFFLRAADSDGDASPAASVEGVGVGPPLSPEEDAALQWDMFTRHQALGEWWGTWTTHDYMGDPTDTTIAGVSLLPNEDGTSVTHSQKIVTESKNSDCKTCFDSENLRTMPVATYSPGKMGRNRCAAVAMVAGPSLLPKSGMIITELALRHGDGRVRVTFQHAPVWERDVEPGSCPPQGLKLFRTLVSKEKLRKGESGGEAEAEVRGPPSAEEEEKNPPMPGNPRFFRGVPPFQWHAKWSGTSWTWGPSTGDRGWGVEELDDADSWHGRPRGDVDNVWSLRLGGGVLIQCPRVIVGGEAGLCRLAWLPEEDGEAGTAWDGNSAKLLRVEASVIALEPIISEDDDSMMVGFHPPSLGSLRCDVMAKTGELEGASLQERERASEGFVWNTEEDDQPQNLTSEEGEKSSPPSSSSKPPEIQVENKETLDSQTFDEISADPRNAFDL